ncbi:MAG: hypothetical protein HY093_02430 [Candidatus Liptonbacteria bacterium]|nr:hypothetical protein [Candidatus Liptonbacteria bacterium]
MKRYLLLGLLTLGVLGLILGGYYLRHRGGNGGGQVVLPNGSSTGGGGRTDEINKGGGSLEILAQNSKLVIANLVRNYFVDESGNVILIQPDGQIVGVAGKETMVLSSADLGNLIEAAFSADGKMILVKFGDSRYPQTSIFDIGNKTWKPVDLKIQSAAWAPRGRELGYLARGNKAAVLGTWDLSQSKTKPKEVTTLHIRDMDLWWVRPEEILLVQRGSHEVESSVWGFNWTKKTLRPVFEDQLGLETLWSEDGSLALEMAGGQLNLEDLKNGSSKRLAFLTLPSKCAFDTEIIKTATSTASASSKKAKTVPAVEKILLCAVPADANQLNGHTLPDDYYKKTFFTEDSFYKIRLADGAISKIFEGGTIDATNLKRVGQKLFFINRYDSKLYALTLE